MRLRHFFPRVTKLVENLQAFVDLDRIAFDVGFRVVLAPTDP